MLTTHTCFGAISPPRFAKISDKELQIPTTVVLITIKFKIYIIILITCSLSLSLLSERQDHRVIAHQSRKLACVLLLYQGNWPHIRRAHTHTHKCSTKAPPADSNICVCVSVASSSHSHHTRRPKHVLSLSHMCSERARARHNTQVCCKHARASQAYARII